MLRVGKPRSQPAEFPQLAEEDQCRQEPRARAAPRRGGTGHRLRRRAAVLAASAPADAASSLHITHAASTVRYVALGDSYSAGLGAGNDIAASGSCDRSINAYSVLWDNANKPASYTSVACAGATTSTVLSSQIWALSTVTTLVSITIAAMTLASAP